eukprot:4388774-Prymnesium_polylepis.1
MRRCALHGPWRGGAGGPPRRGARVGAAPRPGRDWCRIRRGGLCAVTCDCDRRAAAEGGPRSV